jgi:hypothetical protein
MTFKLKECLRMYEGPTLLANSTCKTLVMETGEEFKFPLLQQLKEGCARCVFVEQKLLCLPARTFHHGMKGWILRRLNNEKL